MLGWWFANQKHNTKQKHPSLNSQRHRKWIRQRSVGATGHTRERWSEFMKHNYYISIVVLLLLTISCHQDKENITEKHTFPDSLSITKLGIKEATISYDTSYLQLKINFKNFFDTLYISKDTARNNNIFAIEMYVDFSPMDNSRSNNLYFTFCQYLEDDGDFLYLNKNRIYKYFSLALLQISKDETHVKIHGDFTYTEPDSLELNNTKFFYSGFFNNDTLVFILRHNVLEEALDYYPFVNPKPIPIGLKTEIFLTSSPLNLAKDSIVLIDSKPKKKIIKTNEDKRNLPVIIGNVK